MSSKFLLLLSKAKPIWETLSNLYIDFINEVYSVEGTPSTFDSYVTHSRSGNATMTDSDGLIKWAPHNLLTYSEVFTTGWNIQSGVTVTPNQAIAPDGNFTADKVIGDGSNGVYQSTLLVAGVVATRAIWLKGVSGGETVVIKDPVLTGTVLTCNLTTSWQLFELEENNGHASSQGLWVDDIPAGGIYIWGAHIYRSDLGGMVDNPDRGDSYVPTTSSAVYLPRRGHHVYNGSTFVNEGLLVESESRTNIALYSNDISETTTGWTANDTITAVATGITGIDGVSGSPFKLIAGSGGTSQDRINQQSVTSGTDYAICAILKDAGDGVYAGLVGLGIGAANEVPVFDLANGTVDVGGTTTVVKEAGIYPWNDDGWYFCWARVTAGGTTGVALSVNQSATDNTFSNYIYTGDDISGYYVAYVGCEQTSGMPSFPIPTAGSAITRAAETLTIPSANLPYPTPNVIGSELVTNGTFDTDTDWTKGTGWTISSGQLSHTAGTASLASQTISLTLGKVYKATCDVISVSGGTGSLQFRNGGTTTSVTIDSGDVGSTVEVLYVAEGNNQIAVYAGSATDMTVDNVSVKEIDPLSVSIQMDGRMTYADEDSLNQEIFLRWRKDGNTQIQVGLDTNSTTTGAVRFRQEADGVVDDTASSNIYSADILVPFNIASRHGSTFINGAVEGTALAGNTTPVALPDLSSTDLDLAYDYMGTIRTFRIWDADLTDEGIEFVST